MSGLLSVDRALFLLLNTRVIHPWLDRLFPFLSDLDNFRIVVGLLWGGLLVFGRARGRRAALLLALALLVSDQIVNEIIKPWVGRARPCVAVEGARLLVRMTRSASFPSSHAANIMTSMTVLAFFFRRLAPAFFTIAFLVGYSRVYVGVHYPLDVLGGWTIGFAVALGVVRAGPWIERTLAAGIRRVRPRRRSARVV